MIGTLRIQRLRLGNHLLGDIDAHDPKSKTRKETSGTSSPAPEIQGTAPGNMPGNQTRDITKSEKIGVLKTKPCISLSPRLVFIRVKEIHTALMGLIEANFKSASSHPETIPRKSI